MAKEIEINWISKFERLQPITKDWSKRDLTTQGKVIVVKTSLVSQLAYVMQSISLLRLTQQQINRLLKLQKIKNGHIKTVNLTILHILS